MTADPLVLMKDVDLATQRLLATATALDGVDPPSGLPGWTRGHVLTHLARNADSLVNLLTWARTGVETPQYPSREARDAGIEAGARRPLAEQIADLRAAAERFAEAASQLPAQAWSAGLHRPSGPFVAARIPWMRLVEVEVHHADLAAGYRPEDWPEPFTHRLLHELASTPDDLNLTVRAAELAHPLTFGTGGPPTVSGTAAALTAWFTGRSPGIGLTIDPTGPLPAVPAWR
jgi:maleylpyruvate isomerase